MADIVKIPAGDYYIGDDSIPNAGPRHRRLIETPVWIDARPVTWAHFEAFVTGGGFENLRQPHPQSASTTPPSVDRRCRELVHQVGTAQSSGLAQRLELFGRPITGVTWFEAVAISNFYGARLPFESEWEIALSGESAKLHKNQRVQDIDPGGADYSDTLQEWTLDRFTRVYFRSDYKCRGVPWSSEAGGGGVVVRGATPDDLYQHVSFRSMASPEVGNARRGLRRAWDSEPTIEQITPTWRG